MAAADPFIGQIQLFAINFSPRSWAFCHGALLPIAQNTALFSLLGTMYGGDGRTNFQLPDLQGRGPISEGTGLGLPTYRIGQKTGIETVPLNLLQLPSHTHVAETTTATQLGVSDSAGSESVANGQVIANHVAAFTEEGSPGALLGGVNSTSETIVQNTGGNVPHNNMQPYLAMNYCICLQGVYPSRS